MPRYVIERTVGPLAPEELRDGFHVVRIEVVFRDLVGVEAGVGLDLDHVARVARCGQILAAEITREMDHQRLIPCDKPVKVPVDITRSILTRWLGSVQAPERQFE